VTRDPAGTGTIDPAPIRNRILTDHASDLLFAPTIPENAGVQPRDVQVSSLLMLVFWTVGPLAAGLWRFEDADL